MRAAERGQCYIGAVAAPAKMTRRSGSADLPLHGGRVPAWLGERMTRLGAVISQTIVHHYGRDELLSRLAHPFWFQSFGAVMGMDWRSEEHTSELQSRFDLVCRLLLEKKKNKTIST